MAHSSCSFSIEDRTDKSSSASSLFDCRYGCSSVLATLGNYFDSSAALFKSSSYFDCSSDELSRSLSYAEDCYSSSEFVSLIGLILFMPFSSLASEICSGSSLVDTTDLFFEVSIAGKLLPADACINGFVIL